MPLYVVTFRYFRSNFSETAVPEPSLLTETENVLLDGDTIEVLPN